MQSDETNDMTRQSVLTPAQEWALLALLTPEQRGQWRLTVPELLQGLAGVLRYGWGEVTIQIHDGRLGVWKVSETHRPPEK